MAMLAKLVWQMLIGIVWGDFSPQTWNYWLLITNKCTDNTKE